MKINWSTVIAVFSGLAGVAGAVVTPIWGTHLAGEVQAVIEAISGVLVIIAGYHATTVLTAQAKAKIARPVATKAAAK